MAETGLLTYDTIKILEQKGYEYIIGASLKDEAQKVKQQILGKQWKDGEVMKRKKMKEIRLIVTYTGSKALQDQRNRQRGLERLEKEIKSGKLNKSNINNKGYNQYLKMQEATSITVDYVKFNIDKKWEGLKGCITNSKFISKQVIENFKNLEHIKKAFRMSKTDLYILPFYSSLKDRIKAHICISFIVYCINTELKRLLHKEKSTFDIKKVAELTHNIYGITYANTDFKSNTSKFLKMDDEQAELYRIIYKNC